MSETQKIIADSAVFVKQVFENSEMKILHYHNLAHTHFVHAAAKEILNNTEGINDKEKEAIELAAIFHDVAYTKSIINHEEESTLIAEKFLQENNYPKIQIELVKRLILSTKMGHKPIDILEEVIQDADFSHLACDSYIDTFYKGLHQETMAIQKENITEEEWAETCVNFVEKHEYNTAYAKENYTLKKQNNIRKMSEIMTKPSKSKKKKKRKKLNKMIPEKGIETMFRVSLRNHLNLSRIADNKANTLISVNAIIISIVLSTLFPKLDNNPYLIYPGIALLIFSIIAIIISILSTIPKTTHGTITKETVLQKKGNLIFFGNFHKMTLDDFEWGIDELMADREYLYKTLTRDLYYLGRVLNRKYTLLRYSYYVFVIGLIISTALFILSIRNIT